MIQENVARLVKEIDEWNDVSGKTGHVLPKRAIVKRCSNGYLEGLEEGKEYVFRGKVYPAINDILGKRALFKSKPITDLNSEKRYIEIKGYGINGRQLYFQEHMEGDLFFGMYVEKAESGYSLIHKAWSLGLAVPVPVALLEMPEDEYFKQGMKGLRNRISADISLHDINEDGINRFFSENELDRLQRIQPRNSKNNEMANHLASKIAARLYRIHLKEGKNAFMKNFLKLYGKETISPPEDRIAAILKGKGAGYIIRAPKSPLRVGCPTQKLSNPDNIRMAKEIGKTYRALLENGILHYCPSTGNWTTAGELTDFEDALDISTERERMFNRKRKNDQNNARIFQKEQSN